MNTCVCCGEYVPESSQVCKNCLDDARDDKKEMLTVTIDDLKHRNKLLRKQLFENEIAIKLLEKARTNGR